MQPFVSGMLRLILPVLLVAASLAGCRASSTDRAAVPDPSTLKYVTQPVCAECHAEQVAQWTGSDHDRAMLEATPESVVGDFDDAVFTHFGVETRFFREDSKYFVRTEGRTGAMETFEVKYTFGYYPLQQYLVEFPDGRVQALTVAWDVEGEHWYSLYPEERIEAGNWLHWTGGGMNWNYMCAECHSTNLQKNFDFATDTYNTTFSEINVNCEACHGPGEAHVDWARTWSGDVRDRTPDMGLTVRMKDRVHARRQIETCAPCHSRRRNVYPGFVPGKQYLDHYGVELLDEYLYFPDGQIKDEVYVYGSFIQSKMYHNGVRCSDCHDPHTTRVKLDGNALCNQCHLATTYDTRDHHFHPEGQGANCVDCHMPQRTYMGVDPRRDHGFKVPRPDLTVELGVPNVCTGCHADQTAEWARGYVIHWYGPDRPPTFAHAFEAGRRSEPDAGLALARIVRDPGMPAIVRATAVSLLERYPGERTQSVAEMALRDPEPLVRTAAVRLVETISDDRLVPPLAALLEDTLRLVRTEAARVVALNARDRLGPQQMAAFEEALAEYRISQEAVGDQPEAHLNLAVMHETAEAWEEAEKEYVSAIRLDSTFVPARLNLAMLYNRRRMAAEGTARARQLLGASASHLRAALRHESEMAEIHYSLGLLLAEDESRLPEAAGHLGRAAELSPNHPRMQYNAGLAHQQAGDAATAERFLMAAHRIDPESPDYLHALAILHMQQERWQKALEYTDALAAVLPDPSAVRQQREYIQRQMR